MIQRSGSLVQHPELHMKGSRMSLIIQLPKELLFPLPEP